jgi:hypothetical protein
LRLVLVVLPFSLVILHLVVTDHHGWPYSFAFSADPRRHFRRRHLAPRFPARPLLRPRLRPLTVTIKAVPVASLLLVVALLTIETSRIEDALDTAFATQVARALRPPIELAG